MGNLCVGADPLVKQKQIYSAAGQGHIFENFENLSKAEQTHLLDELKSFNPTIINNLFKDLVLNKDEPKEDEQGPAVFERIEPELTQDTRDLYLEENAEELQKIRISGLDLIKRGKVNCLILAGGQGSRLGFDHPKGMYNIGLPS